MPDVEMIMGMEKGLPENWRKLIEGKKVVFFNTSIGNLLSGGEKHINKIVRILEIFHEQRNIVLWWRPHPLELSTVEAMRPELALKYKLIRKKYETEKWGILDTSTDVHRAIAVSDAYYGDWSSVIFLYKVTGKPILISSDDVENETDEMLFYVKDAVFDKTDVWFISVFTNVIYKMSLDTYKITEYAEVQKESNFGVNLFLRILKYENRIVLLPSGGRFIVNYNTDTKETDYIEIRSEDERASFCTCYCWNDIVYLFPYFGNKIIKYDIKNNQVIFEKCFKFNGTGINLGFYGDMEKNGQYIYGVKKNSSCIYKYNVETDECKLVEIDRNRKFCSIKRMGKNFVLLQNDSNNIILWDEVNGTIKEIKSESGIHDRKGFLYKNMVKVRDDLLYIFPYCSKNILRIKQMDEVEIVSVGNCGEYDFSKGGVYTCVQKNDDKIWAYSYYNNQWDVMELNEEHIKSKKIEIEESMKERIRSRYLFSLGEICGKNGFYEKENNSFFSLPNYIKNIEKKSEHETKEVSSRNVGKAIHQHILSTSV